jgi:YfiH family protein
VIWRHENGLRWLEAELPGGRAAFSTRLGGVSEPPYDSLNLAALTGDGAAAVRRNRHRVAAALGLEPDRVLIGRQVHGVDVIRHEAPQRPGAYAEPDTELPEADGAATAQGGLAPLVLVADCLPVAMVGPRGAAMVHCGWRGLAGGIVARGAAEVEAEAAVVGPGIGRCCYEVGDEVLAEFAQLGGDIASGRMLDLPAVAERMLQAAGIERVEVSELCTSCNPDLFYSHRRDGGRTGRQAGLAWLD